MHSTKPTPHTNKNKLVFVDTFRYHYSVKCRAIAQVTFEIAFASLIITSFQRPINSRGPVFVGVYLNPVGVMRSFKVIVLIIALRNSKNKNDNSKINDQ